MQSTRTLASTSSAKKSDSRSSHSNVCASANQPSTPTLVSRAMAPTKSLSLREYQTTLAVRLTKDEREALQAIARSVSVSPTPGVDGAFDLTPSSWVGAIELPTLAIEIRPKVPL